MSARWVRRLNVGAVLVGLLLLGGLLAQIDRAALAARLVQVGWRFGAAFLAYVAAHAATAAAWYAIVDPAASRARYLELFGALWAGHAINGLTPGATAGEFVKGTMLAGKVEADELVASLVTFNFLATAVVHVFTLLGPLVCLAVLDLPVAIVGGVALAALLTALPVVGLYVALRRGALRGVARLATRLPGVGAETARDWIARGRAIDARVRSFRQQRPRAFVRAIAWLGCVRLLLVVEVVWLLVALLPGRSLAWIVLLALLVQTSIQLLEWVLAFVPGQVGVSEGGSFLLFRLLHLDPVTGLSMELLRRVRKVLGIAIGLGIGLRMGWRGGARATGRVDRTLEGGQGSRDAPRPIRLDEANAD